MLGQQAQRSRPDADVALPLGLQLRDPQVGVPLVKPCPMSSFASCARSAYWPCPGVWSSCETSAGSDAAAAISRA